MKKLKTFLILLIISIFFIPKVFASTTTYNGSLKYSDTVLNLVETYSTKLNNLHNYLTTHCLSNTNTGSVCMSSGKYLIAIDTSTMSTNSWTLTIFEISQNNVDPNYNTYMTFQWRTGTDYNCGYWRFNSYGHTWKINFVNNSIRNYTYQDYGGQQYNKWFYASNGINPMVSDIEVIIDNRYFDTYFLNDNLNIDFKNTSSPWLDIPLKVGGGLIAIPQVNVESKTFFDSFTPTPSYTYTTTTLENGNVKVDFTFQNYNNNSMYGYEIMNYVSGEYYGSNNIFGNYPKMIPYENNFSIEVSFDTVLYVRLYQYEENGNNYSRIIVNENTIDINNVTFENSYDPYFSVIEQTNNSIKGRFINAPHNWTCEYSNSNNNLVGVVICDEEEVDETFNYNGYISFTIKNTSGTVVYNRKINVLGADNNPYITYSIDKQSNYNVINWEVQNRELDANMEYRYSTNNGSSFTNWQPIGNVYQKINVFNNTTAIIEIADNTHTTIYDSKAITIINNIANIKNINNNTNNLINAFKNIFTSNSNILNYINSLWEELKISKLYLIIFIPFIISLIYGIIILIRKG